MSTAAAFPKPPVRFGHATRAQYEPSSFSHRLYVAMTGWERLLIKLEAKGGRSKQGGKIHVSHTSPRAKGSGEDLDEEVFEIPVDRLRRPGFNACIHSVPCQRSDRA